MAERTVPDAVKAIERRHIRKRVLRLTVDDAALTKAIHDQFGTDLDAALWKAKFDSTEPDDVNHVAAIVGAYERLVNGLVETARSGITAGGLAAPGRSLDKVPEDLAIVRDDGGLTSSQYKALVGLNRVRNELQHDDIEVAAEDAREAIARLRRSIKPILASLNAWLLRYGVGVARRA